MLTNADYMFLLIAFLFSIIFGLILRILYYSKNPIKSSYRSIINVLKLQIYLPYVAYKDITTHRTDYINKVNRDERLSLEQKVKRKKDLSSNKRIAIRIILNSIIHFRSNLDRHINLLNNIKKRATEETGEEIEVVIKLKNSKSNVKDFYKPKDMYKQLYA